MNQTDLPLPDPIRAVQKAAPEGTRPLVWVLLLIALIISTGFATWSTRRTIDTPSQAAPTWAAPSHPMANRATQMALATEATSEVHIVPEPTALRATIERLQSTRTSTPATIVDRWVVHLATEDRDEMREMLTRKTRYEPLIRQALTHYGIPQDLIYLALIESGFRAGATSHVGAAGVWQFMPNTARSYGLEVSHYVDERRDPVHSTYAALRYLSELHDEFHSWHLAAAAYNAGEGRIRTALMEHADRLGGDEILYWMIRPNLPRETRDYVPKLLAAARIANNPIGYGFTNLNAEPPLAFQEVWVEGGVSLEEVARRTSTRTSEVLTLNPHLVRGMTPPGRRWPVRIPAHQRLASTSLHRFAGYSNPVVADPSN